MRVTLLTCLLALLQPSLRCQTAGSTAALEERLHALVAAHHGEVALYAESLATHQTVQIAADTPVQTASVIKLAILYEALEQVRAGKARLDDRMTLTKPDQVQGSGVLSFFDAPLLLSFKDVLTMMIVMSDNTATNLAIDRLGLANIDGRLQKLGMKDTYLYKKVFTPVAPGAALPEDYKRFGLGKTTAREMAQLMGRFVRCDLAEAGTIPRPADAALCQVALKMLHDQFYRTGIPRYLDAMPGAAGDSIANKTGSLDAVRNDVAAISTKNGMVLLSVFTFNNQDHTWTQDQEAELTIAKVAKAVVEEWSPQGLAAWPSAAAEATK